MRKDGIGYLPQFDSVVETVEVLLKFFYEERGIIELSNFVEIYFEKKNRSRNTIRLLQNTLSNYGLIRETQDYVYVITDLGKKWLESGSPEELIKIIHEHVNYIGEILSELENSRLTREEIQKRAVKYYDVQFNNTDITRRLQVFRSVGMVNMNRKKEYILTQKGADFLHNIILEKKRVICETKYDRKETVEILQKPVIKMIPKKIDEELVIKNLYEKIVYYLISSQSFSKVTCCGRIQCKTSEGPKIIEPDVLIYFDGEEKKRLQFVIEIVTEESRKEDFLNKLFDYKKIGVEECWMVDYVSGNVMVYDWKNRHFSIEKINDSIKSNNFRQLNINFSQLKAGKSELIELDNYIE